MQPGETLPCWIPDGTRALGVERGDDGSLVELPLPFGDQIELR